jgi:uroporphyrinogen-III synthase
VSSLKPLAGKRILVTRPLEQAGQLIELIRASGGQGVVFPAIEIKEPTNRVRLDELIQQLDTFDLAIFISPTAVSRGLARVLASREWPPGLKVAAVGQGSAGALAARGLQGTLAPAGRADSEALLALPEMAQVSGKRIIIFRGEGGREILAESLRQRGAMVEYAECYRRAKPAMPFSSLLAATQEKPPDCIIITSSEGLNNLLDMADTSGREQLMKIPFFVPHERIAKAASQCGIQTAITTTGGDAGIVEGMIKFFQS